MVQFIRTVTYELPKKRATPVYTRVPSKYKFMQNAEYNALSIFGTVHTRLLEMP
jgi:hypothetical protein